LVSATALQLAEQFQLDLPFSFNRKEAKDHGEGGNIVGAPLQGNILIIDDVITAGMAIRESFEIIKNYKASPVGVVVALDRQEKGSHGDLSAIQEVERDFGIKVVSIVGLSEILEYLQEKGGYEQEVKDILEYRKQYGINQN